MPTWNDFVKHPNYDDFWQKQAFAPYLTQVTVPTLNVAGWLDQEDFYGPLKIYELLEKHDKKNQNFLVVGPWNHGGWAAGPGDKLGKITFDSDTGKYFREKVQAPWFAYWLKDKGPLDQPEALTFQTGTNKWVSPTTLAARSRPSPRSSTSMPRQARLRLSTAHARTSEACSTATSPIPRIRCRIVRAR